MTDFVYAADMGGTRIKLGLVSQGRVLARRILPSESHRSIEWQMDRLEKEWYALRHKAGMEPCDARGIGLSFPAIIDGKLNRPVDYYGKYPGSSEFDYTKWAEDQFSLTCVLENDARCALLGESRYGAGRDIANAVMFTLGTGIGSALMEKHELTGGARGIDGNLLGHRPLPGGEALCVCGRKGCAEAETSLTQLNLLIRNRSSMVNSPLRRVESVDYKALFDFRRKGDPLAIEISDSVMELWAEAMFPAVTDYRADMIILGGGIMASGDIILPFIESRLRKIKSSILCSAALCGDDAALLGAGELIKQELL